MKLQQKQFSHEKGWKIIRNDIPEGFKYELVIGFGSSTLLADEVIYKQIKEDYPNATILLNTTSGEILDVQVSDETISLTAIHFEKTKFQSASINMQNIDSSFNAGMELAASLNPVGLKNVLVISDGQLVNGSELVSGLQTGLPKGTIITGGMAGDGTRFTSTLVGLNHKPSSGNIVVIGFYGQHLQVSHGSVGGWDTFGPERLITKASANVLFELDNKPALDVYKMYLGDYAKDLPGSALLFPLSIKSENSEIPVVRTILGINEEEKSLTFAGNMPVNSYAQLMRANFDRLIEGASDAAKTSLSDHKPDLAILISCVGRRLVLDQRIEEELEVVRSVFGKETAITGFYSYGEISPSNNFSKCELHNQTMTITTFSE